jgi:hypothetical protein
MSISGNIIARRMGEIDSQIHGGRPAYQASFANTLAENLPQFVGGNLQNPTMGDLREVGDFLWNGTDGRGGISHAFGLLPPPDPAPMRTRPAPPQVPQQIPAWHPPMRPREDWEQMVSR